MTPNNKALNQKCIFYRRKIPYYSNLERKGFEAMRRSKTMSDLKETFEIAFLGHRHGKSCSNHDLSKIY